MQEGATGKKEPDGGLHRTVSCAQGDAEATTSPHVADAKVRRGIHSRHAQMIAIGGIIGTGLFVGSGQALAVTGPGTLLLAYCIICVLVYGATTTIITVGTYIPLDGSSMAAHAARYVSESLGFAMGWLYWYTFGILVAYEITAAALVISYWPNPVHIAVWLSILWLVIVGLNMMPVRFYAESEFWFAGVKVIMIVGLILFALILAAGGGPSHEAIGFRYWRSPGAVNEYLVDGAAGRFCALLYATTFSLFSFLLGPETIVLMSGEIKSPRKNLPRAANSVILRLVFFYVLGVLAVGVICPSNAKGLLDGGHGAAASPWTIAMRNAGIQALDSIINAGIILSAWSAGNSFLYMSSRALYSLACNGMAPAVFSRINRWGVPSNAVLFSALYGVLSFLNVSSSTSAVFNWFISFTNIGGLLSWISCCIVYIRFKKACAAQGVTELPYESVFQPFAVWATLTFCIILALLNGFYVFFPGHWSTESFLTSYLGIPVFLTIYSCHRLKHRHRPWAHAPGDVDLVTGLDEVMSLEEDERSSQDRASNGAQSVRERLRRVLEFFSDSTGIAETAGAGRNH